jgi:hypothetical protein
MVGASSSSHRQCAPRRPALSPPRLTARRRERGAGRVRPLHPRRPGRAAQRVGARLQRLVRRAGAPPPPPPPPRGALDCLSAARQVVADAPALGSGAVLLLVHNDCPAGTPPWAGASLEVFEALPWLLSRVRGSGLWWVAPPQRRRGARGRAARARGAVWQPRRPPARARHAHAQQRPAAARARHHAVRVVALRARARRPAARRGGAARRLARRGAAPTPRASAL